MDGDSSEDDSEDSSQGGDERAAEEEIRRHLQSKIHSRGNKARTGDRRCTRPGASRRRLGADPRTVSDREVNEHLRELALEEDRELQRVQDAASGKKQKTDTTSHEEFPNELRLCRHSAAGAGAGSVGYEVQGGDGEEDRRQASRPPAPPGDGAKELYASCSSSDSARSQTAARLGSAFDGTPPADDCWPDLNEEDCKD